MHQAPQVSFASQAPAPSPSQYPAPYSPYGVAPTTDVGDMLGEIMPLIILMMVMGMMMPMMKGITAQAR